MPLTWPTKYADEVLDYKLDWSASLATGETITNADAETTAGAIVVASKTHDGTSQTVWLSAGASGGVAQVCCTIVTSAGRTFEEMVAIRCW